MSKRGCKDGPSPRLASSPCLVEGLRVDGGQVFDLEQARDVARWRKVERERLLEDRRRLSADYRATQAGLIALQLDRVLAESRMKASKVSVYWPIRGEPDLRFWMQSLTRSGTLVALPVALALGEPLLFRTWQPQSRMARGLWNIPYPVDGKLVIPNVVIVPLVGFDRDGYRLGYGGGFFDRTLAALTPKPIAIGVGYPGAEIQTIFPQPHDIKMDVVATGEGSTLHWQETPV